MITLYMYFISGDFCLQYQPIVCHFCSSVKLLLESEGDSEAVESQEVLIGGALVSVEPDRFHLLAVFVPLPELI